VNGINLIILGTRRFLAYQRNKFHAEIIAIFCQCICSCCGFYTVYLLYRCPTLHWQSWPYCLLCGSCF